mmetsp:Transcript_63054/g.186259  ORF Transcript_63054/g.186259 Transcript_63054/m.186259 type:complete len:313 (-) Transcript_63054:341-1279(-)
MGAFRHGLNVPEVIVPILFSPAASYISAPPLAGAFIPMMPTLFLATFRNFPSGVRMCSAPKKVPPPSRRLDPGPPIVQPRVPSVGVVFPSRSFPYRHNPASRRRESRAPSPAGLMLGSSRSLPAMDTACSVGMAISNPSSPVYPHRVMRHPSTPSNATSVPVMNAMLTRSNPLGRIFATASVAPVPCTASSCIESSRYSMLTSPSNASICSWKCFMSPNFVAPFTTMYTLSPALVMTVSSMMPPFSLMTRERHPDPGDRPAMSPTTTFSRNATRSLPCQRIWPIWETSNRLAFPSARHQRCSFMTPPFSIPL